MYKEIQAWNTGRQYTANGQRIAAGITEDNTVIFADIDRTIFGEITEKYHKYDNLQWFVMYHYDRNNYHMATYDKNLAHCANEV